MPELKGKVALVTGGGGGLGEAICQVLGEAGIHVIAADVREAQVQKVAQAAKARGFQCTPLQLDITQESQIEQALHRILQQHDRLDILVNNAGVDVTAPVGELSIADWDRILSVNLRAPFILSKYAFSLMKQHQGGQIVNVISTAAKRAWANATAYHASKWGLLGLSYALHVEGRPNNIKVTAVINGGMRTPFILERFPDTDPNALQDPKNVAETIKFVLSMPAESVIPEVMVIPMRESSWP